MRGSDALGPGLTLALCTLTCVGLLIWLWLPPSGGPLRAVTVAAAPDSPDGERIAPAPDTGSSNVAPADDRADAAPARGSRGARSGGPGAVRPRPLPRWLRDSPALDGVAAGTLATNRARRSASSFAPDAGDLAVLQDIIDANALTEGSSPFDYDDGDGRLDPWELGFQAWSGDRLVVLAFGPGPFSSFGYDVRELPPSIGRLGALRLLDAHGGELARLPAQIGELADLRALVLSDNQLEELPYEIGFLQSLETLAVNGNRLTALPGSVGGLVRLTGLSVAGNPLPALPASLAALPIRRLDVRGMRAEGPQASLAAILASVPVEELHVTPREAASIPAETLARVARLYGVARVAAPGPR